MNEMTIDKETMAQLLSDTVDSVTVQDNYLAEPIIEQADFDFGISDDGELVVYISPPDGYYNSIVQS